MIRFHATLFPCPETPPERREMITGVVSRIEDLNTVLNQTIEHRRLILIAAAKNIRSWFVKIHKLKSIYSCLNMLNFDVTSKCLIAEVWYPLADKDRILNALKRGTVRSGATVDPILMQMPTKLQLPTFHRTNKFTSCFQDIVDSYGVAKYREVNPAPFTIITFPFIFAIMFGDAGHGLLMFLAAFAMIWKERQILANKNQNEIFGMFFTGRYIILLMGLFSIYTGMLYNDVFAKSVNLFGSAWAAPSL
jgi:V-type H+-transporting ATPase subunit a